jgi:hypothetical protein
MNPYKLLLVLNRTDEKPNLKLYLDWFKANTPIDVQLIDTIYTDFDVTTKSVGNATFKGVICGDDIVGKLRNVIPEGKYNAVALYVGNQLNGIRVSTVNGGDGSAPLYPDTELIQLRTITDNGRELNHELFHSFCYKANKCQAGIKDPMDTYILDADFGVDSVVNTNREMALKVLKPFWNMIVTFRTTMPPQGAVVTLQRNSDDGVQTLGTLTYGSFSCKTLERPWVKNMSNISCIPTGTYTVKWTFSLRLLKYTYEVQAVPNRSGIRFHPGNFFFDVEGCILLGDSYGNLNKDKEVDILNSRLTIKKFEDLLNRKDFTLIIK